MENIPDRVNEDLWWQGDHLSWCGDDLPPYSPEVCPNATTYQLMQLSTTNDQHDHSSEEAEGTEDADNSSTTSSEHCSCVDVVGAGDISTDDESTEVVEEYTEAVDVSVRIDHNLAEMQADIQNTIENNADRAINAINYGERGAEHQRDRIEQTLLDIDRKIMKVLIAQAQIQVQQRCLNDTYNQQQHDMFQAAADGKKLVTDSYCCLAAAQSQAFDNMAVSNGHMFENINRSIAELKTAQTRSNENTAATNAQHNRLLAEIAAAQYRPSADQAAVHYRPLVNVAEQRHIIADNIPTNITTNNQQQLQQQQRNDDDNDRKRRRIIVFDQTRRQQQQQQQQIAMNKHIGKLNK